MKKSSVKERRKLMAHPVSQLEVKRREKLLSRWALSVETKIYPQRLAAIERGQIEPKKEEVKLLSKALGLPVKELISLIGV